MDLLRTEQKNEVEYVPLPPSEGSDVDEEVKEGEETDVELEDQDVEIPLQDQIDRYEQVLKNNTEYIDWLHKRVKAFEDRVAKLTVLTEDQHKTIQELTQTITNLKEQMQKK